MARNTWRAVADHLRAHGGPDAVGADQGRAHLETAVRATHLDPVGEVAEHADGLAGQKLDRRFAPAGREQGREQILAVHHHVAIAVAGNERRAQRDARDFAAVARIDHNRVIRKHRVGDHILKHAERIEHARSIGRQLDSGADLAKRAGLLQHPHPNAAPRQRQRARKPANAAAGHQHRLPPFGHVVYCAATRMSKAPMPSISACIRSPGTTGPTPSGVPVRMMSPGCKVYQAEA